MSLYYGGNKRNSLCYNTRKRNTIGRPTYFIKPLDDYKSRWTEVLVRKKTHMWEKDPELHKFLDKKVMITGDIIETKSTITVDYFKIENLE